MTVATITQKNQIKMGILIWRHKMEQNKYKRFGYFLLRLSAIVVVAIMLYLCFVFAKSIVMFGTTEFYELDTEKKINYITEVFNVKDTNNIGAYTVSFEDGFMILTLNDVKDIHDLCFENLAYYDITQIDYYRIVNSSVDESETSNSYVYENNYQGENPVVQYHEMEFENESNNCSIAFYKKEDTMYCEIKTGRDFDVSKKLKSMN